MRSIRTVLTIMLAAAVLVACQPAAETPTAEEAKEQAAADVEAIEAVADDFVVAFNAGDVAGLVELMATDVVWMPPGEATVTGSANVRTYYQTLFDSATATLTVQSQEVEVAGDWAYSRGTYTTEVTPNAAAAAPEGEEETGAESAAQGEQAEAGQMAETATETGRYLNILRRQDDGSWVLARHMWNTTTGAPVTLPEASEEPEPSEEEM